MLAVERGRLQEPDVRAVERMLAITPVLRRVARAGEALGLGRHELLHAGPPLQRPGTSCKPIEHSAITAILFEGWAGSIEEAERLLRDGVVALRPAQDNRCAVPLADVVSPSMWVQEVGDIATPVSAWSPINGGMHHVLRAGVLGTEVLEHLRWINGPFARALHQALREPIALLPLADLGLAGGDDCHGRTAMATAALAGELDRRWVGADAQACRDFLRAAPSFFLNCWMGASKCMLDAARGIATSSIVVGAGGNGIEFGIQIAAQPSVWYTVAAEPPLAATPLPGDCAPLGAIGDSALVDCLGLGAMTTTRIGQPLRPPYADLIPDAISAPQVLLAAQHPGFPRVMPRVAIPATQVTRTAQSPVISLGILDSAGRAGRLAGGYYRPPLTLFARAVAHLDS